MTIDELVELAAEAPGKLGGYPQLDRAPAGLNTPPRGARRD
jgi:hypothetical protein